MSNLGWNLPKMLQWGMLVIALFVLTTNLPFLAMSSLSPDMEAPRIIQNRLEYRLEFLHIPKTGGTLIEVIALEHGVPWGACKFLPPWRLKRKSKSPLKKCPKMKKPQVQVNDANWHDPITVLLNQFDEDPYDNVVENSRLPTHKKFFAVIRNPYSWFISLYTMCPPCHRPESLSDYVQRYFQSKQTAYCQYEYLYNTSSPTLTDPNGTILGYQQRIVEPTMVVRIESLKGELEALWARHGYGDWQVPLREERPINQRKTKRNLSIRNFTRSALTLIHDRCRLDFVEGPYDMVDLQTGSWAEL